MYDEDRYCPNCGASIKAEWVRCPKCLSPLQEGNNLRNYQNTESKSNAGKVILGIFGVMAVIFILIISSSSGNNSSLGNAIITKPDIRISNFDVSQSFNLAEGVVSTVNIVLTNYGNANGTVELEFTNQNNQVLETANFWVPKDSSKSYTIKVDTRLEDTKLGVRIIDQWKD